MDKNRLGVGIVFSGLDDGLSKSAKAVANDLDETTKAMRAAEEAARGRGGRGFMADLREGLTMLSISRIGSTINDVNDGVSGSSRGFNDLAKSIDTTGAKLRTALDPKTASQFTRSITGLVAGMGVTGDQAQQISNALVNSGASLSEMRTTMPMIGTLVGKMGMDAEKVASSFAMANGNLNMTGREVNDLTKEVFKLQRDYQLTNLVEGLPELFENAYTNLIKFGKINGKEAARTVQAMSRMTAQFQKLGFSQQQAGKMSTDFNDKITDIREAFLDLEAGLDPQSDVVQGIYDAFGAGGLNATGIIEAIKSGKHTPDEIMKQMQGMVASITDPTEKNNAIQRLKRLFGPEMTAVLDPLAGQMADVGKKAQEIGKGVTAEKAFADVSRAMGGTLEYTEKLNQAAHDWKDAITQLTIKGGLTAAMNADTKATHELSKAVTDADSKLGAFARTIEGLKLQGLSYLFPDAAAARPFLRVLSDMIYPLTSLMGLMTIFGKPLALLGKGLILPFKLLGKSTKLASAGIQGVGFALGKTAKVAKMAFAAISSPIETLGSMFGWLKEMISPIMRIVGKLMPSAMRRFGGIAASMMGGPVVAAIAAVVGALDLLAMAWPHLTDLVRKFSPEIADVMDSIGENVGAVWDSIKEGASFAWDTILDGWDTLKDAMMSGWKVLKPFLVLGFKAIATVAGVYLAIVEKVVVSLWKGIKSVWSSGTKFIGDLWQSAGDKLAATWEAISSFFSEKWKSFKGMAQEAMKPIFEIGASIKNALGIGGEGMGTFWDDMLVKPFQRKRDEILGLVSKLGAQIVNILPDWAKNAFEDVSSFASGILNRGREIAGSITGAVGIGGDGATDAGAGLSGAPLAATEGDAAGAKILKFPSPSSSAAQDMGMLAGFAEDEPEVKAIPIKRQKGATAAARAAGVDLSAPRRPQVGDKNFQAVVDAITEQRDTLAKLLAALLDKDTTIEIKGDMRKFLKATNAAAADDAGRQGLNAAVGR